MRAVNLGFPTSSLLILGESVVLASRLILTAQAACIFYVFLFSTS